MEVRTMFSYEDYKEIIRIIQSTGNQAGYEEALTADKFVIMRHDVEYSVDRAYALAKVESSMDFTSTFFFQWTNNSYNILSRRNQDLIKDMHERGHDRTALCIKRSDRHAGGSPSDQKGNGYPF